MRKIPPVKFLLVDDKPENLLALEALLRRDGLEILQARSGVEALEILLAHEVALALLDVHMPEIDGFALAEMMRGADRTRHVPIIFVTAAAEERNRLFRGYDAGAVDFLVKPIDPRILRHKTETFFQLHRQRLELEETLRLNETFMAAVGHDLRNPLNAIVLMSEALLEKSEDPATLKIAERVRSSGRRMAGIIDDLYDLTHARRGDGIPIARVVTDALSVVRKVVSEHEPVRSGAPITIVHEGDTIGEWDAGRLAQVFSNLVANAIHHGAPGKPIEIEAKGDDGELVVCVKNEGVIPPDLVPVLFDPFRSGRAATSKRDGLGLGLFIVDQIVLAHGGSIVVTSNAEVGTIFCVKLPKAETPESKPSFPPRAPGATAGLDGNR